MTVFQILYQTEMAGYDFWRGADNQKRLHVLSETQFSKKKQNKESKQ
jgi:hypothetical protein